VLALQHDNEALEQKLDQCKCASRSLFEINDFTVERIRRQQKRDEKEKDEEMNAMQVEFRLCQQENRS
jgi:hypothetical protein